MFSGEFQMRVLQPPFPHKMVSQINESRISAPSEKLNQRAPGDKMVGLVFGDDIVQLAWCVVHPMVQLQVQCTHPGFAHIDTPKIDQQLLKIDPPLQHWSNVIGPPSKIFLTWTTMCPV